MSRLTTKDRKSSVGRPFGMTVWLQVRAIRHLLNSSFLFLHAALDEGPTFISKKVLKLNELLRVVPRRPSDFVRHRTQELPKGPSPLLVPAEQLHAAEWIA
jgi:hypothetical protein